MGHGAEVARVQRQLVHDVGASERGQSIRGKGVGCLPAAAVIEVPRGIVEHGRHCVGGAWLIGEEGLGRGVAGCGEVLDGALGAEPGRNGDKGIVSVVGQVRHARHVGRHMLALEVTAVVGAQVGDVENAIGVGASVDALCGQRLDATADAVVEAERIVERVELVVVVVDGAGVREGNGEDTYALGGYRGRQRSAKGAVGRRRW